MRVRGGWKGLRSARGLGRQTESKGVLNFRECAAAACVYEYFVRLFVFADIKNQNRLLPRGSAESR